MKNYKIKRDNYLVDDDLLKINFTAILALQRGRNLVNLDLYPIPNLIIEIISRIVQLISIYQLTFWKV